MERFLNKITLGDSYKLIKELPNESIDCIYTDIPYLIESGGGGEQ
jgi:DNA modification methylase